MRIDNRFFNRVILIAAVFSFILIAVFSWDMTDERLHSFQEEYLNTNKWDNTYVRLIGSRDSTSFKNVKKPAIVYFWSGWSELGMNGLKELAEITPDSISIYAAVVKDNESALDGIDTETSARVNFVYGTNWYLSKKVPAVPTLLFIDSHSKIRLIEVGFKNKDEIVSQLELLNSSQTN
ncbi:hypothetical protein EP331_09255 [bacterium]|nr:MAG: hypothetical protein EP331_09255 [bacterium]